ncbi:MAG: sugar phosphate isomerase/epimerase family protein, partial [Armatimonadota bacterium]
FARSPILLLGTKIRKPCMRTFIGGERHQTSQQRREELIGYTVENFKRLAEVAERVHVPLVLENHEDLTSIEVLNILKAVGSPYVRALIDNGNALPVRENPVECVFRLAPHASACHLKDWKVHWVNDIPMREGCPLGEGDACAAESYRILRDAQPDMPITMEIASIRFDRTSQSAEEEDANVVKSVGFLKTLDSSSTNSFED